MTVTTFPPQHKQATCAECGRRIRANELLWRELPSGTVRAAFAADLEGLQREGRGLWHPGCLPRDRHHDLAA